MKMTARELCFRVAAVCVVVGPVFLGVVWAAIVTAPPVPVPEPEPDLEWHRVTWVDSYGVVQTAESDDVWHRDGGIAFDDPAINARRFVKGDYEIEIHRRKW